MLLLLVHQHDFLCSHYHRLEFVFVKSGALEVRLTVVVLDSIAVQFSELVDLVLVRLAEFDCFFEVEHSVGEAVG